MTPEPQGAAPEDTSTPPTAPSPPAVTRWPDREEQGSRESELMPPYIPGGTIEAAEPAGPAGDVGAPESHGGDHAPDAGAGAPSTEDAELTRELEPPALPSLDPDATEADGATMEPEPADTAAASFPFDMPWGETAEPGAVERDAEPASPVAGEAWPPDTDLSPESAHPVDTVDAPDAVESAGAFDSAAAFGLPGSPADDLADRLEALASRLRAEGRDAVERELASDDRFASLLAGILSGYLAARGG